MGNIKNCFFSLIKNNINADFILRITIGNNIRSRAYKLSQDRFFFNNTSMLFNKTGSRNIFLQSYNI